MVLFLLVKSYLDLLIANPNFPPPGGISPKNMIALDCGKDSIVIRMILLVF